MIILSFSYIPLAKKKVISGKIEIYGGKFCKRLTLVNHANTIVGGNIAKPQWKSER